jgi:hypothetical protein
MTLEGGDWLEAGRSADGVVASPRAVVAAAPEVVPFSREPEGPEALARAGVAISAGWALEAIANTATTFPAVCFQENVVI